MEYRHGYIRIFTDALTLSQEMQKVHAIITRIHSGKMGPIAWPKQNIIVLA